MEKIGFLILRIGMAITFLWIGILIFQDPVSWGGYIKPWAAGLLPVPLEQAMIGTAILDFAIGLFLLLDVWVFWFAALGTIHLLIVLMVSGIDFITVRDIGLLAGTLALAAAYLPKEVQFMLKKGEEK